MSDIREWLDHLDLGEYAEAFEAEKIAPDDLTEFSEDDLGALGLPMGPRRRVLKAARALTTAPPAETVPAPVAPPREAERRQITVMFCDLVGSTALAEKLDPEDLRSLMQGYQKSAGGVIERYEGHVAQYLGDGLMIYFGWPQAHEDDAERAVRAGLDIVKSVSRLEGPVPLEVRIGIATGSVVVGESSSSDTVSNLAVGETPNLAARLQGLAGPNQLVISDATRRLVGGVFELEGLGQQAVKGLSQPVSIWRVDALAATEGRFDATHGAHLTPMVGRDEEVASILRRWESACDGDGQLVLLCGEPGIGKSRVTQVLHKTISEQPSIRLRYQCSPFFANTALYSVIQQFEFAARFERDDSTETRLSKMDAVLGQALDDPSEVAPLFAAMLSIDVGDNFPPLDMTPQQQMEATQQALCDQVIALSKREPVLMIFEDAHWVDPTTQGTLDLLVPRLAEHRILLVVTYRPEYQPPWSGMGHILPITLTRLARIIHAGHEI